MELPIPRLVVLSPHLDDAALSCGGLIAKQTRLGGRCDVVTVHAGAPTEASGSPAADAIHARMGNVVDPVALRLREDAAAVAILGAEVRHLTHLDVVYRSREPRIFLTSEALTSGLDDDDSRAAASLSEELVALYPAPAQVALLGPLGVGNHVDHIRVHRACRLLSMRGYQVFFYEDFPYSLNPTALRRTMDRLEAPVGTLVTISEDDLERRLAAIRCYQSQAQLLFPDPSASPSAIMDRIAAVIDSQTASLSDLGGHSERVWQLGPWRG